jgi:hypothetical protein
MELFKEVASNLQQLKLLVEKITPEQFIVPSAYLFQATIGQHTRHAIEMYQCLIRSYESGEICYDDRKRDKTIETDKEKALSQLNWLAASIEKPNKALRLKAGYNSKSDESTLLDTNYFRELAYNLEHTIHHMALIRVGLQEIAFENIPEGFGVASSTIRHQNECAQ